MNKIVRNITTVLVSIAVWTVMPQSAFAQCKIDNSSSIKGEFSINGTKVSVKGDGNNNPTSPNNIPIKICEGEIIKLSNTLPGTVSTVNYWILPLDAYLANGNPNPPKNPGTVVGGYTTNTGESEVKIAAKTTDPNGFSFYEGPKKYVIFQYDYSTPTINSTPGEHYACQVIEVIAPPQPSISITTCNEKEFQITIPVNANNIYDDYEVHFDPVSGSNINPVYTGKQTLPYTFKASMPDNSDRIIYAKGITKTGGCAAAPATPNERKSVKSTSIFNPTISLIKGTATKGEFKIAVSSQADILRQFYIRDPQTSSNYDFSKPFGTPKVPNVTSGIDTVAVTVPDGNKQYCFLVENMDASCPATGATPFRSREEICTTPVVITAEDKKNVIKWTRAIGSNAAQNQTPFIYYQVERLNVDGTLDKPFPVINDQQKIEFEDTDGLVCGNEYTYQVTTNYGLMSTSQKVRVKAISNDRPPKISGGVYADINDNPKSIRVQGNFNGPDPINVVATQYKFYQSNSLNGTYSLKHIGNKYYNDVTTDYEKQQSCYYMTWTNACNIESEPSEKICNVNLKYSGGKIKWTNETSLSYGTDSYNIKRVDKNGTPLGDYKKFFKSNELVIDTLHEREGQEIFIKIESQPIGWNIIGSSTLPTTSSNVIRIFRPVVIMAPQIFTPNGDDKNEKFVIRGKFIQNLILTIYDRWGNPIFSDEQKGYPFQENQKDDVIVGWDGKMNNGEKAMPGSYAFKAQVEGTDGTVTVKEGALLLEY